MLVDGKIRRICITKVDGVKEVRRIDKEDTILPEPKEQQPREVKVYKTQSRHHRRRSRGSRLP